MTDSSIYFVKSIPPRAFIRSFQHFADMLLGYIKDVHKNVMVKK